MATEMVPTPGSRGTSSTSSSIVSLPNISPDLSQLLSAESLGPAKMTVDHGFEPGEVIWKAPAVISLELRKEACAAMVRLAALPVRQHVLDWLKRLAMATAGRMSVEETVGRATTYAELFALKKVPAALLTPETWLLCAESCKWFPSFSEIMEVLAPEMRRIQTTSKRLETLTKM